MPSRDVIKTYQKGGYYHVYNRGNRKEDIFWDTHDFEKFLEYFFRLLLKVPTGGKKIKNYHGEIDLIAFCLLKNHVHLLIRQKSEHGMTSFMRSLNTGYSLWFNYKYKKVGRMYQGVFKARLIENEKDLLNISKYIHLNPVEKNVEEALVYRYSSIRCYLKNGSYIFVSTDPVLSLFGYSRKLYAKFLFS